MIICWWHGQAHGHDVDAPSRNMELEFQPTEPCMPGHVMTCRSEKGEIGHHDDAARHSVHGSAA
jgi:hypothetical protein